MELSVDTRTGLIDVEKCVLACDVGKAINPSTVEGQMQGGLAQGIGWSLMEEHFFDHGRMKNATYHDYLIPTSMDLPDIETIIVEHPSDLGPCGAKGIGEPALIPSIPATMASIGNALGVTFRHTPILPKDIVKAWKDKQEAEAAAK